jgi:hypothetical protein
MSSSAASRFPQPPTQNPECRNRVDPPELTVNTLMPLEIQDFVAQRALRIKPRAERSDALGSIHQRIVP